ncbi:hypothetical protein LLH06_08565 [Mucilaginibacter daejeonensis]|uniref:M1 family aminopeptidase n=1 Tax=Mucilaginibacter daejeonensis TaxID=398049 RepID=UPI001D179A3C|nr:M1 family aminopeptidase [Mucilaginibacter daejeonensis]UEG55016.1 hypothetical protein LLH06_08565 [Mucilaginibacter daejeonensis]
MTDLLKFELGSYFKKPAIYVVLILLFAGGIFIDLKLSFNAGNDIYRNSPYCIAMMIGLLSLTGIFLTTLFAAQILLKESDARFDIILYATPLVKRDHLLSRFGAVLALSALCFTVLVAGYMTGQLMVPERTGYQAFHLWLYVQPLLLIGLPNLFLCAVLVSAVAWSTRNKFMIFICGLFIYISYLILLTYSGSPLMAGSLPRSSASLELAAKIDPFGLSAFYHQTNLWAVELKNTSVIHMTGNLLLNRLIYLALSIALLFTTYYRFQFKLQNGDSTSKIKVAAGSPVKVTSYRTLTTTAEGIKYTVAVITVLVKQNMKLVLKSRAFTLIGLGLIFYMSMEFYGSIDQGIRLPEQYATTGLMVNRILFNLPGLLLLVTLFYAQELYWRSHDHRFHLIENSTPVGKIILLLSKWMTLTVLNVILITMIIFTGIVFQLVYGYTHIELPVYALLYWLIGVPLAMSAGLILIIQHLIGSKWLGLTVCCIAIALLATSMGKSLGMDHPLMRFMTAYTARYSEMNGWDDYSNSFIWRMIFGSSVVLIAWVMIGHSFRSWSKTRMHACILLLSIAICTGMYIFIRVPATGTQQELDERESYERAYRPLINMNQPVITCVKTSIDLYPTKDAYQVQGYYKLTNPGPTPINKLLVNYSDAIKMTTAMYRQGRYQKTLGERTGLIDLERPLLPGDSATLSFSFSYQWNGFTGHESFNAIVHNGSFLRISNYFPRFGYQTDEEISLLAERKKRRLGTPTPLTKLEAPRGTNNFIDLDMTVSVPRGQSVVGVGELERQWTSKDRAYFRYISGTPIPFRFGLSAANYHVSKMNHKGVEVAVYYDSKHPENVAHLIRNAVRTIDYCRSNFGPYPYKTIRFAEISSFTEGFAGTAYPATIFMTEQSLFHANLGNGEGHDVINELAAHELSHQWWGNQQLAPDEREGSKLLTETLAMYTELMLAKRYLSPAAVQGKITVHKSIYDNERGFSKEPPLYRARTEDIYLYYDKGLLVMNEVVNLIGEKKVNRALRNLLEKHAYPHTPPVSTDLINELCAVSDQAQCTQIKMLFTH